MTLSPHSLPGALLVLLALAGGGSWQNLDEAEFVVVLYRHLVALYPQVEETSDVGIISPYKAQVLYSTVLY